MEISEESLYQRYSEMETEELVDLNRKSELSDLAQSVLKRVLSERSITTEEIDTISSKFEEEEENVVPLASLGSRFIAQFIDALAAFFIFIFPLWVLDVHSEAIEMAAVLGYIAYLLFQDALPNGQSIGKRFLGIYVVNKTTYKSCSIWASMIRNIFLVFLGFIDLLFLGSKYRQRLGDKVANTIVLNKILPNTRLSSF